MAEELGKFSLEHVSNVYLEDPDGNISNHTNWRGTADGYGVIYGTLIFGPTALMEMNDSLEGGPVKWIGQAFLEDGTGLAGSGSGQSTCQRMCGSCEENGASCSEQRSACRITEKR